MKYCVEISEEQLRIISVAVDEYMRLRMGQFEPLTEDLVFDGEDKKQLYEKPYDSASITNESIASKRCLRLPINWPTHRLDTGSGNTIHGERASTLYTLSSISSG